MTALKTITDKMEALKQRKEAERALGAKIDRALAHADMEQPGCGICHMWKRMTGRQRSAALVAVVDGSASSTAAAASTVQTQSRLFGVRKSDPHSALKAAAESMERRIQELESRTAAERAEARRQMLAGQKASAMRMLKKAKATEKQLEANQASLMAVEQQVDLMAQAQMQKQVASALASSSKGMKAQKKLIKNAEAAVDDAQDARDMADDLGNVMCEFAQNGTGNDDDDDLLAELQSMMVDDDPPPPTATVANGTMTMMDVSLDDQGSSSVAADYAKQQEMARLEARLARYDKSLEIRNVVAAMPAVPLTHAGASSTNGKAGLTHKQLEKEALLANRNGQA